MPLKAFQMSVVQSLAQRQAQCQLQCRLADCSPRWQAFHSRQYPHKNNGTVTGESRCLAGDWTHPIEDCVCEPQQSGSEAQLRPIVGRSEQTGAFDTTNQAPMKAQPGQVLDSENLGSDDILISSKRHLMSSVVLLGLGHVLLAEPSQSAVAEDSRLAEFTPAIAAGEPLSSMEQAIIDVFERNTYSVVNIVDTSLQGPQRMAIVDQPEGNGTGFVWDTDGHIVTNYHVLGQSLQNLGNTKPNKDQAVARVTLLGKDGSSQTLSGYLVGADRSKDLAVVRVNAPKERLQPVSVAPSSKLRVGQQVLCIGNPFGFDHTLTTGVISGVKRDIQSRAGTLISGGIQTDAAINPGNSGGPLLNSKGELIGVNTAIFSASGASAGVGFAIPSDAVSKAVPQLISYGKIIRPSLRIQVATEQISAALQVGKGALVQQVEPNSNAAKAGLLGTRRTITGISSGDVIIAFNGLAINSNGDLVNAIDEQSTGNKVTLTVRRDNNKVLDLDLVLQEDNA